MIIQEQISGFGEIDSLKEIFWEAKKLRRARHPAHVLVVDDDPLTRRVVVGALGESHAMITEESARGGLASYLMHAPDVVFLDIGLPDIDGFSVLEQILALDPDAFIVMFSSHSDTININKAFKSGAKGFVPKPFRKDMLERYIEGSSVFYHKSCM